MLSILHFNQVKVTFFDSFSKDSKIIKKKTIICSYSQELWSFKIKAIFGQHCEVSTCTPFWQYPSLVPLHRAKLIPTIPININDKFRRSITLIFNKKKIYLFERFLLVIFSFWTPLIHKQSMQQNEGKLWSLHQQKGWKVYKSRWPHNYLKTISQNSYSIFSHARATIVVYLNLDQKALMTLFSYFNIIIYLLTGVSFWFYKHAALYFYIWTHVKVD